MKEALNKMQNPSEQSMCWQDGRLFEDKEDWIVDSCTKCTCQEGKVVCRQITCPPVACANPSFIDGECCPVCLRKYRRMKTDTFLLFVHLVMFFIDIYLFQQWTVRTAGLLGQSGHNAQSHVEVGPSSVVALVMTPAIRALDPPFRRASAVWENVTAEVQIQHCM